MQIETLPPTATVSEAVSVLDRDGAVILEDLASSATMDAIDAELNPYLDRCSFGEGYFVGLRTKRLGGLVSKSPAGRELILQPTVLGVMEKILGQHCARVQLNLTQAIQIWPGEVAQVFHRDDELFPCAEKRFEFMINAMWARDDFTKTNGATQIVVGSHRHEPTRDPDPELIADAVMPRGSVLIYLGSAVHAGGANRSNRPRLGFVNSYSLGWLRQAENLYLSVPPHIARTLSPQLQQLVGYAIHAPNLGWYEGQDPGIVLNDTVPDVLPAKDYMPPELNEMLMMRRASLLAERLTAA